MAKPPAARVNLTRLSYVIYEHPSLPEFSKFAVDFGLEEAGTTDDGQIIYYRGYGIDPFVYIAQQAPAGQAKRFVGAGFAAESEQDFQIAAQFQGARVVDASAEPGAGQYVHLVDPNGFEMHIRWGQRLRTPPDIAPSSLTARATINGALEKRRMGQFTRVRKGPAMIHKLGHFGYATSNFEETCAWYNSHFNLDPTDILHVPGNPSVDVAIFYHLNCGKAYVDHHCFLLARSDAEGTTVHHSSFEVEDMDTQFMGHQWLEQKGYELVWGIGRHFHGSQLFDYWYDPSRFIIEHYADGDVVNEDTEICRAEAGNMAVWGPPAPAIWR